MSATRSLAIRVDPLVQSTQTMPFRAPSSLSGPKEGGVIGISRVEVGSYGVQVRMGKPVGVCGPGVHWTVPLLDKIVPLDARLQTTVLSLSARSQRGLPLSIELEIIHQLIAERGGEFLHAVGAEYGKDASRILAPVVGELVRRCAAALPEERMYGAEILQAMGSLLCEQLEPYGIGLLGIHLRRIGFAREAEERITRVAVAQMEQAALEAELRLLPQRQLLLVGTAQMEAEAYAARRRIEADADAYAEGRMHSEEVITEPYLELERIKHDAVKWRALENMAQSLGSTAESIGRMLLEKGYDVGDVLHRAVALLQQHEGREDSE